MRCRGTWMLRRTGVWPSSALRRQSQRSSTLRQAAIRPAYPDLGSVHGPRDAFIHEGERVPPLHVSGVERIDVKSRRRHKIIDLAVEMTATAEAFPTGCQAMLPPCDPAVWRKPMLHEQQTAIPAQYAPHLAQRRDHFRYRAQRPCRHHSIEDIVIEWND